jgi:hypothetical protein
MTVNLERSSFGPDGPGGFTVLRHKTGMADGASAVQQQIADDEARTNHFKIFAPVFVPGVLQTRPYAYTRFMEAYAVLGLPLDDIEAAVETRMARSERLWDDGRGFHVVLAESVLYGGATTAPAMLGQLRAIRTVSELPNVRLGVLPMRRRLDAAHPMSHVDILDDSSVLVETLALTYRIVGEPEVAMYVRVFDGLAAAASYGSAATSLIDAAVDWWATQGDV